MKLMYGGTPVKALNINYFEQDTNDATMIASDLQAGVTCYARGQKVIGTGRCFEFASYGAWMTNVPLVVPSMINVVEINSATYPIRTIIPMRQTTLVDFATSQTIAEVIINGTTHPIIASVQNGMLTISCEQTIDIELFYGKDRYI